MNIASILILLIILTALIVFFLYFFMESLKTIMGKTPFVPSSTKLLEKTLAEIKIKPGSTIYDLGSGSGKLLFYLEKNYKNLKLIGFDNSLLMVVYSNIKKILTDSKVNFYFKNFLGHSYFDADYVFCFIFGRDLKKLSAKLIQELPKGSYVLSNTFCLPGWTVRQIIEIPAKSGSQLNHLTYVYQKD